MRPKPGPTSLTYNAQAATADVSNTRRARSMVSQALEQATDSEDDANFQDASATMRQ